MSAFAQMNRPSFAVRAMRTLFVRSLGGAKIAGSPPPWANGQDKGLLVLDRGTLEVPFCFVIRPENGQPVHEFGIIFDATTDLRRALMVKLFTGSYRSTVDPGSVALVV